MLLVFGLCARVRADQNAFMALWPYVSINVIRARINKELERKFRELAMKKFGYTKGSLQRAAEEAIARWVAWVESENLEFEGDPVEAIDGILADLDADSVGLQHKARELWASKVLEGVLG